MDRESLIAKSMQKTNRGENDILLLMHQVFPFPFILRSGKFPYADIMPNILTIIYMKATIFVYIGSHVMYSDANQGDKSRGKLIRVN